MICLGKMFAKTDYFFHVIFKCPQMVACTVRETREDGGKRTNIVVVEWGRASTFWKKKPTKVSKLEIANKLMNNARSFSTVDSCSLRRWTMQSRSLPRLSDIETTRKFNSEVQRVVRNSPQGIFITDIVIRVQWTPRTLEPKIISLLEGGGFFICLDSQ